MKKLIVGLVLVALVAFAGQVFAESSMAVTPFGQGSGGNTLILKIVATAAADGTFDSKQITASEAGLDYWEAGYRILDAWAVNSATDDHTNAAVVTITDETGRQLVGATAGDTLTLSQTASAVAYLSIDRGSGQRIVSSKLTVAIADTGSTATVQTLYIVLGK